MTEHSPEPEHQVIHADAPVVVAAPAGSRLEQLHAQYEEAKAARDAAAERFDAISAGIKAELAAAAPDRVKVDLPAGAGPALRLVYTESWRLDSKKLKAADPYTYAAYAKQSGSWSLKPVTGTGSGEG
jgi:hypothetical protein